MNIDLTRYLKPHYNNPNKTLSYPKTDYEDYWETRARNFEIYSTWCKDLKLFRLCTEPLMYFPSKVRCLDLGGGSGWVARRDAKLSGRQWTVLDHCSFFSKYVKPPVKFVVADIHSTPFPSAAFDYILIRSVLQYVNSRQALTEAKRLLSAGGCLVVAQKVATYNPKDQDWFRELNRLKGKQILREWRASQLNYALKSQGLTVVKWTYYTRRRKINVNKWFGVDCPLANPRQDRINDLFKHAPDSVIKNLQLEFNGDELAFDEHWAVFVCYK